MRLAMPLLLMLILSSVFIAACGQKSDRADNGAAMSTMDLPATQSNGVLTATIEYIRRSPTSLSARIHLENISKDTLELRNLGDTLTGFCCLINGQRISAPVQRGPTATAASTLTQLPPSTPVELDLTWHFAAGPTRGDYPFSIIIGNLFQDGRKLSDLCLSVGTIEYPAAPQPTSTAPPSANGISM